MAFIKRESKRSERRKKLAREKVKIPRIGGKGEGRGGREASRDVDPLHTAAQGALQSQGTGRGRRHQRPTPATIRQQIRNASIFHASTLHFITLHTRSDHNRTPLHTAAALHAHCSFISQQPQQNRSQFLRRRLQQSESGRRRQQPESCEPRVGRQRWRHRFRLHVVLHARVVVDEVGVLVCIWIIVSALPLVVLLCLCQ
jgi:hypothetical protein